MFARHQAQVGQRTILFFKLRQQSIKKSHVWLEDVLVKFEERRPHFALDPLNLNRQFCVVIFKIIAGL